MSIIYYGFTRAEFNPGIDRLECGGDCTQRGVPFRSEIESEVSGNVEWMLAFEFVPEWPLGAHICPSAERRFNSKAVLPANGLVARVLQSTRRQPARGCVLFNVGPAVDI